jgi:prolyl-tRNA synthetase
MGTSHNMGENFARVFNIRYAGADGQLHYCCTMSFGLSTRIIGGLVMTHGDDRGLRLPPVIAPLQVVVIPIALETLTLAERICDDLVKVGVRAQVDARTDLSFGRRSVDWELKGVPCRIEIGRRELQEQQVTIVRRDTDRKQPVSLNGLVELIRQLLGEIQDSLSAQAAQRQAAMTRESETIESIDGPGFHRIAWSAIGTDGETVLARRGQSVRCLVRDDGMVPDLDTPEERLIAYVAKAY